MFEILVTLLSIWLFIGSIKLAFKIAWGTTKIIASVLLALAVPVLVLCLVFAGGAIILLPALLIAGAFGLLKKCA
jgi:hypothetical protein